MTPSRSADRAPRRLVACATHWRVEAVTALVADIRLHCHRRSAYACAEEDEGSDAGLGFRERQQRRRELVMGEAAAVAAAAAAEEGGEVSESIVPAFRCAIERTVCPHSPFSQAEAPFNLEGYHVPLREWVAQPQTTAEIKRRFVRAPSSALAPRASSALHTLRCRRSPRPQRLFLEKYSLSTGADIASPYYSLIIDEMAASNGSAITISFMHLSRSAPVLAIWLADLPREMLRIFDKVRRPCAAA